MKQQRIKSEPHLIIYVTSLLILVTALGYWKNASFTSCAVGLATAAAMTSFRILFCVSICPHCSLRTEPTEEQIPSWSAACQFQSPSCSRHGWFHVTKWRSVKRIRERGGAPHTEPLFFHSRIEDATLCPSQNYCFPTSLSINRNFQDW